MLWLVESTSELKTVLVIEAMNVRGGLAQLQYRGLPQERLKPRKYEAASDPFGLSHI